MSPSFNTPTAAELALVKEIFDRNDPLGLDVLTGDAAVSVFGGSKLPGRALGEIWTIADEENNGWLSRKGTAIALRLIAHAQKGERITPTLLSKPTSLPAIEGYGSIARQGTGTGTGTPTPTPTPLPADLPPLSPQDKIKFQDIFRRSNPVSGLLSGEKARDIFLKSKLPNVQLTYIWNLADTQGRGSLDDTDFAIAMYFIQGLMTQQISFVPSTLPPGLYEQAGGHATIEGYSTVAQQSTDTPTSVPALPDFPPLSPQDKIKFQNIFRRSGSVNGLLSGEKAREIFLRSTLSSEQIMQIWDLADTQGRGSLDDTDFVIAMYFIQGLVYQKISFVPLILPPGLYEQAGGYSPNTLPSLVPPSMRSHKPHGSPFQAQLETNQCLFDFANPPSMHIHEPHEFPNPAQPETAQDLLRFDDDFSPANPPSTHGHEPHRSHSQTQLGLVQGPSDFNDPPPAYSVLPDNH